MHGMRQSWILRPVRTPREQRNGRVLEMDCHVSREKTGKAVVLPYGITTAFPNGCFLHSLL